MVWKINCDCSERTGTEIKSIADFNEIKYFFLKQTKNKIFTSKKVAHPYYIGVGQNQVIEWYADKWYVCNCCGTLWEVNYPDFPAKGFVRKFSDGKYYAKDESEL